MAERLVRPIPEQTLKQYAEPLRPIIEAAHQEAGKRGQKYAVPAARPELNRTAQEHADALNTNRREIMANRAKFLKNEDLTTAEKDLLLALSDEQIRKYTMKELHAVYVGDKVEVSDLKTKIAQFDDEFGESFKNSIVRKHYEDMIKVIALWNNGKALVKGLVPSHDDVANLPDFNLVQGQVSTSLIDLLWETKDRYTEVMLGKPGQRLLDVLPRLDKSSDDFMYIDRDTGREVIRNESGQYVARGANGWEKVDKSKIGFGYVDTQKRIVVNVKSANGSIVYVDQNRLKRGPLSNRSLDRKGDFIDGHDVVEPFNYGRTPAEKIYSRHLDPRNISEIEITAQRIADALAEPMIMTKEETDILIRKSRGDLSHLKLPNTPKQDKINQWATHHGLIQKVHNTAHYLSQEIVDSLPEALMNLTQKSKPRVVSLSDGRDVTLTIDKKGSWQMLFGMSWKEIAKLSREDVLELGGKYNQVIGSTMPYDRMKQAADVIDEAIDVIKKEPFYGPDEAFISWASGKISKYSKPWSEKFELFVKLMREVTPREIANLQQQNDVTSTVKDTIEHMRKFIAWHEFLAYKVSPLFIQEQGWVKGYKAEDRGRQIANELFAVDESVINDPIVGAETWKNTVVDNLYGRKFSNFTGGVVFEQWLKSFNRFQEGKDGLGVKDSKGVVRAITFAETLQFLGMKMEADKYKTNDGTVVSRRRLKMLSKSRTSDEWRKYLRDPNHGVDPLVAASLREFFNAGSTPIDPKRESKLFAQVLPPYFDVTDLFRVKYAAIDWFLENRYPNRLWAGDALSLYQKKINQQQAINEHGSEDAAAGLLSNPFDKMRYRWGYVKGREPLALREAALRMSSESRLEISPDTSFLDSKRIKLDGTLVVSGKEANNDIVLYKVGNSTFKDPVLDRLNISNHLGYATLETLITMSRKDALSIESIEYGSGNFVSRRGGGYGTTRAPIDLARRPLQIKIPMKSVEHSVEFQKRIVEEDVAAKLGIDPHTANAQERKILRAHTELKWDQDNKSLEVASPTDVFFQYLEIFKAEKITLPEMFSLCNMAGCHMGLDFDSNGKMQIKFGQGAAFVQSMMNLDLHDTFLDEMLKQNVEKADKTYQYVAQLLGSYFVGKNTLFVSEAVGEAAKASTITVKAVLRNARLPVALGAIPAIGSIALATPILKNLGVESGLILNAATWGTPVVIGAFGAFWAGFQTWLIKSSPVVYGRVSRSGEYIESWIQSKTSKRSSLSAHEAGCAVWNGIADDVVENAKHHKGGLYNELANIYDQSWSKAHRVPAPTV